MSDHENGTGVQLSKASLISVGSALVVLFGAIEFTWRMSGGLSDMRDAQTASFGKIDGQIQLLKYQLEQQAIQISDIRSFIGQSAPGKK
jgi:hypothetical protein